MATHHARRQAVRDVQRNSHWRRGEVWWTPDEWSPTYDLEARDGQLTGRVLRVWGVPEGYGGTAEVPTDDHQRYVLDNLPRITEGVQWQLDKLALAAGG